MAKQPPTVDLEEGLLQGTNVTSNEPKLVSEQEKEPITGHIDFPLVEAIALESDQSRSYKVRILWPYSANHNYYCCIYRVPCRLRSVNPDAYTPQMLLIGPLHHSKKGQADELSKTEWRYLEYMKMERHKEKYLENFALMYGKETVDEFRGIIKRDEEIIRACYAESTDSIKSEDFVKMMLLDSVFILVFCMQAGVQYKDKTGDFILDELCHQETIVEDLFLLENQLPFILLENLFDPFLRKLDEANVTFRDFIIGFFGFKNKVTADVKFRHFTDLYRLLLVQTLGLTEEQQNDGQSLRNKVITNLNNANKLDSAGVQFVADKPNNEIKKNISLLIKFEHGILTMSCFRIEDGTERVLRNIMALEQCHYPYTAFVCNYIIFLDFLIDNVQDVDFLVKKDVIENWLGRSKSVAEMVNKLCIGIVEFGSNYFDIVESLNDYYDSRLNRTFATLQQVYFKDLWTGTAHVAAVVILVLTLIGTVASVLQVKQKDN